MEVKAVKHKDERGVGTAVSLVFFIYSIIFLNLHMQNIFRS